MSSSLFSLETQGMVHVISVSTASQRSCPILRRLKKKDGRSAGEERAITSFKDIRPLLPKEGLLVPSFVIDEAMERIKDGSITDYVFDREAASFKPPR